MTNAPVPEPVSRSAVAAARFVARANKNLGRPVSRKVQTIAGTGQWVTPPNRRIIELDTADVKDLSPDEKAMFVQVLNRRGFEHGAVIYIEAR